MSPFAGEFIGMALLFLMGGGVVANVVLNKTNGQNSGWIVITFGWAMAVFIGVYTSVALGGSGHLNPAVTIALAATDKFSASLVPTYLMAQFGGAITGAVLVWLAYFKHFSETDNADLKKAIFCTAPPIRSLFHNLVTEAIGTFVLMFGALSITPSVSSLGTLDALPVALLVLGIGLSLGGPTGYAINPARDLGPRIAHFFLPIPGKRDSDWAYSWVPVAGPVIGALAAAFLFGIIK
ncbi:MAG: aquaporin family protein [Chitinophagaceae bacterium]|nr:aquaporin family protein [Chitinophagaceae bacterium]MBK8951206.1 aquaporin family protein [Chitinophagaceae bacterium]